MAHVSNHALLRFQERVEMVPLAEARRRIMAHAKAIDTAARMNCTCLRLGDGSRLILEGDVVTTVYGPGRAVFGRQLGLRKRFSFSAVRGCSHQRWKGNDDEE